MSDVRDPADDMRFDALTALAGAAYERARAAWLAEPARARRVAEAPLDAQDWRAEVTARILLGWLDHGEHFARLLADLDAENFAEAQASIKGPRLIWDRYTARALTELGDARLPLCWEALLKHAHDWPPPKLGTFTWMLRTTRHPRSIDVVLAFVAETSSAALAEYALRALLPGNDPAVLARELQAARERAGWRIHVLDAVIGELESPA